MAEGELTIRAEAANLVDVATDAVIAPVFADEGLAGGAAAVDGTLGGVISDMRQRGEFRAELHDTAVIPTLGWFPAARVLLLGLGKRRDLTPANWSRAMSAACRVLALRGLPTAATDLRDCGLPGADAARAAALGAELARYAADAFRTADRHETPVREIVLLTRERLGEAIREGQVLGRARNLARELVNLPGNILTPTELAHRAAEAAAAAGLEHDVLGEEQLKTLNMGGIVAVMRGSEEPACMILLKHLPRSGAPALALVGKAVTFDTGGISLKPRENMQQMKGDMAGGAAVIGAMEAIARLDVPLNVIGIIPAADNMPGGRAWKPGDVITMRSGKTVETVSTDAEGRMLLADALNYAQQLAAARIVDIATLTGSCVVALGRVASGLYGTDAQLVETIRDCGELAGERHWPMPLFSEYRALNRSDIADLKNSAGREAGSIAAAWFLREFVDDRPWAHLDIAGSYWQEKGTPYAPAGPTGTGVGTLFYLARRLAADSAQPPQ